MVQFRNTQRLQGVGPDGEALEVNFYTDTYKALSNLLQLHGLHHLVDSILPRPPFLRNYLRQMALNLGIATLTVYEFVRGKFHVYVEQLEGGVNMAPPTLSHLQFVHQPPAKEVHLIRSVEDIQKCEDCGRYYKASHTCNLRRREFYFHQVNGLSCNWWEEISFFPLGACPLTERLYITYDVETYTFHGACGKQLIPFMLVFAITGKDWMVKVAEDIALQEGWDRWTQVQDVPVFYCLNPQKRVIGHKFKNYRNRLQNYFTNTLWREFVRHNRDNIERIKTQFFLDSEEDIMPEMLREFKWQGEPKFLEVYVVGHNINGFDEIVLAAQVIQNKLDVCKAFNVSRNFMPRNGKILFNDITFGLPNPAYEKRHNFELWEDGGCDETDFKFQYVKFMVRDTFALTHASLRNVAKAYNLEVGKGCCPYQAVNQFYMLGSYQADPDGFPQVHYWANPTEYAENREMWLKEGKPYDIIQKTLEYCVQDVIVTYKLVNRLVDSYGAFIDSEVQLSHCRFNILQRPTISSNSHAIFRQILYREEKPNQSKLGYVLMAPSHEMYDYVRQSIRGGRCYPTYLGVLNEPIYVYDICGMYASALTHPFPAGKPLAPYDRNLAILAWQEALDGEDPIDYFDQNLLPGIFTIDADAPDEKYLDTLPPFCSKKGGRLAWTNENLRGEVATSIDMITLHNRKWKVRIVSDPRCTVFPEWKCLCQSYVTLNIKAKEKADREKNQTVRSIAKLLSNALYGSFATKLDNKKIIFGDQLENHVKDITTGKMSIKATSFIEVDDYCAEILPEFQVTFAPWKVSSEDSDCLRENEDSEEDDPLYTTPSSAPETTIHYKPIIFLEADDEELCLHTLEKNTDIIENNRYPSQIASFVLAWTRAFVSEWASFLFAEDWGKTTIEERPLKAIYGDTDSLFVTARGRELMETAGKHRIKKNGGRLIFDPEHPDITWLVECETQCGKCGGDAYSTQSVFLAPKLYGLKDTYCDVCREAGKGKLRAKGHAAQGLDYNTLVSCYYSDVQQGSEKYVTSRQTMKRTLASAQESAHPFTVTETTLTRTLRPWKDKTLVHIDQWRLAPYSNKSPNPRNQETCLTELPWNM